MSYTFNQLMDMDIFARAEAVNSMTDEQKAHMIEQLDIMEAATEALVIARRLNAKLEKFIGLTPEEALGVAVKSAKEINVVLNKADKREKNA